MKKLALIGLGVLLCAGMMMVSESGAQVPDTAGVRGGLVVHLGCGDGEATAAFRTGENYLVHGLDTDAANVEKAREFVKSRDLYGKVSVDLFDGKRLPYIENLVNLLVAEKIYDVSAKEILRVLTPGGVARIKANGNERIARQLKELGGRVETKGQWVICAKPVPAETDEWTHYLHGPDNNAVSQDRMVAAPKHMQFRTDLEWSRKHHNLASVSGVVTAKGRFFYVMDTGPSSRIATPSRWWAVARDAYNGTFLWKRPIDSWTDHKRGFRSGPAQLPRLLVTDGDFFYVPLAIGKPLTALDAATGKTARAYAGTEGTEEVLLSNGVLLVVVASPSPAQAEKLPGFSMPTSRILKAFDPKSAKLLWQKKGLSPKDFIVLTLAADDSKVYYAYGAEVVALDLKTGRPAWNTNPFAANVPKLAAATAATAVSAPAQSNKRKNPGSGKGSDKRFSQSNTGSCTLVVKDGAVVVAGGKDVFALSADNGKVLWKTGGTPGFKGPQDVFVINGKVWLGSKFTEGRDLLTGEVKAFGNMDAIQTAGHHHRCYRNKATERYIIGNYRGLEFMDLEGDDHSRSNWIRGLCQYGVMPANGLMYAPPHSCGCFMEAKLYGFWALAPAKKDWNLDAAGNPLEKGPAFGKIPHSAIRNPHSNEWPSFRKDVRRSGATPMELPKALGKKWGLALGTELTAPVVADGLALVADTPTHTVHAVDAASGARKWSFTAGGRIDSPPTIHNGTALFGCRDGWVYCLRLSDGALAWRFRAAPADLRSVDRDQVESLWPVFGSVLVQNGLAYFCAGRNSYIDGGLFLYALEPGSGKVVHRQRIHDKSPEILGKDKIAQLKEKYPEQKISQNKTDYRTFTSADRSDAFSMAGNMNDIVTGDGEHVFLRHLAYEKNWQPSEKKITHLFSTSRFTDGNENHRSHMTIGLGFFGRTIYAYPWIPERFGPKLNFPVGLMFVYEGKTAWGIQRGKDSSYTLYQKGIPQITADDPEYKNDLIRTGGDWAWSAKPTMRPRAILKAAGRVYLGGMPLTDEADPYAALEGRKGGLVQTYSAADGSAAGEVKLDSPVIWNGLAAAGGKMYVCTMDGNLVCLD